MTTAKKNVKNFILQEGTWQRGNMAKGITVYIYIKNYKRFRKNNKLSLMLKEIKNFQILGNVDMLSAWSATASRGKFLFLNLLIYFILRRGGWSDSDIKFTLPSSKSSYARYYYKWIFTSSITRFWAREGRFYVRIWSASPP